MKRTFSNTGSGISASAASALLDVETPATASHAQCVSLVPSLTKASGSFPLFTQIKNQLINLHYISHNYYLRTYKYILT